jgi:hypothetical protein
MKMFLLVLYCNLVNINTAWTVASTNQGRWTMSKMREDAEAYIKAYEGEDGIQVLVVEQAKRVLLLDKVSRLRKAGADLYRRSAIASFEGQTKDFERLGRGAANCIDKAAELYKQAESI